MDKPHELDVLYEVFGHPDRRIGVAPSYFENVRLIPEIYYKLLQHGFDPNYPNNRESTLEDIDLNEMYIDVGVNDNEQIRRRMEIVEQMKEMSAGPPTKAARKTMTRGGK